MRLRDSFPAENILNLSHADHIIPLFLQYIQGGPPIRLNGIVMTIGRPLKFALPGSGIGPCNYPANLPFIFHGHLSCDLTIMIQILKSHGFLISADLQNRIRRSIHDHVSRCDLMFAVFLQDFCPAGGFITYNLPAAPFFQLSDQFLRETVLRKCLKWFCYIESHHLPMTGHRVLSYTGFF